MAPSGELMVGVEGSKYLALQPMSDVREALMANLQAGESITAQDLVRVPTPAGGGKVWSWKDAGNNDVTAKSIDGVLVYYGVRGTLWPTTEATMGRKPVLVTYDLDTAVRVSDDIGDLDAEALESCRTGDRTYDWKRLPWNQWGSGNGGVGKRCKESRLLAILRQEDAWPVLITAGPGSLLPVGQFVKRLPVAHFRAEISLTLEKAQSSNGNPYSQIVPKLLGTISREEGEILRKLYTLPLSKMAEQLDVGSESE
jgi:hypothetical protein